MNVGRPTSPCADCLRVLGAVSHVEFLMELRVSCNQNLPLRSERDIGQQKLRLEAFEPPSISHLFLCLFFQETSLSSPNTRLGQEGRLKIQWSAIHVTMILAESVVIASWVSDIRSQPHPCGAPFPFFTQPELVSLCHRFVVKVPDDLWGSLGVQIGRLEISYFMIRPRDEMDRCSIMKGRPVTCLPYSMDLVLRSSRSFLVGVLAPDLPKDGHEEMPLFVGPKSLSMPISYFENRKDMDR